MKNLFVFLLTLVLVSSVASALPVTMTLDKFELDDIELEPNSTTLLDLERDMEYPVRIQFTPTEKLMAAEFMLFVNGYDYEKIVDSTIHRVYEAGVTYTEKMTLALPSDIELGEDGYYKLRLLVTDGRDESMFGYNIKIDTARHKLVIEDIILSPAGQVESGRALYANARVSNEGRTDEDDVKVVFSIPELGVRTSAYIEEIEAGEEEEIEDGVALLLPACVEEKEYIVEVTAFYDNKHKESRASESLWIVEGSKCKAVAVSASEPVVVTPVIEPVDEPAASTGKIRSALEVALLVLVGLLVVIGLIIGFSKLGSKDEF